MTQIIHSTHCGTTITEDRWFCACDNTPPRNARLAIILIFQSLCHISENTLPPADIKRVDYAAYAASAAILCQKMKKRPQYKTNRLKRKKKNITLNKQHSSNIPMLPTGEELDFFYDEIVKSAEDDRSQLEKRIKETNDLVKLYLGIGVTVMGAWFARDDLPTLLLWTSGYFIGFAILLSIRMMNNTLPDMTISGLDAFYFLEEKKLWNKSIAYLKNYVMTEIVPLNVAFIRDKINEVNKVYTGAILTLIGYPLFMLLYFIVEKNLFRETITTIGQSVTSFFS